MESGYVLVWLMGGRMWFYKVGEFRYNDIFKC